MKLQEGLLVAGRYQLVRLLGRGGMGSVWLAEHTELRVQCAVKFIERSQSDDAEYRGRFTREARAAASLKSPHVVQILDTGDWEGMPYIAMELLEGESLGQRLRRVTRLPPAECAEIVGQISRALNKAHAAGIVHRDLKPDNVFLTRDDDRLLVKILDFGIAKVQAAEGDVTATGVMLGTPGYMSPEQTHGSRSVDGRSDLWSLGVITYQCLTGEKPFKGTGVGELIMNVMSGPIPVPSSVAPYLPPGFDAWWARAASRAPEGRFQSARELAEQLVLALGLSQALHDSLPLTGGAAYRPSLPSAAEARTGNGETTRAVVTPAIAPAKGRAAVRVASSIALAAVIAGGAAAWYFVRVPAASPAAAASLPAVASTPSAQAPDPPREPAVTSASPAAPPASTDTPSAATSAPRAPWREQAPAARPTATARSNKKRDMGF
jgi:serine/threonine protein kinase